MTKQLIKTIALLLIVGLNWSGILAVGETVAYFSDTEIAEENTYTAGSVDFSIYLEPGTLPGSKSFTPYITPAENSYLNLIIQNDGTLDFDYDVRVESVTGPLCEHLTLKDDLTGVFQPLLGFSSATTTFSYKSDWNFTAVLPNNDPLLQGLVCNFKFVFDGENGFSDSEEIMSNITAGSWTPEVTVIEPNGGEVWYMVPGYYGDEWCVDYGHLYGMNDKCEYEIKWNASDPNGDDGLLKIDIWFCNESGSNCFAQIGDNKPNTGSFWWRVPSDNQYLGDDQKIWIIAENADGFFGDDMSDEDFCPLIPPYNPNPEPEPDPEPEPLVVPDNLIIVDGDATSTDATTTDDTIPGTDPEPDVEPPLVIDEDATTTNATSTIGEIPVEEEEEEEEEELDNPITIPDPDNLVVDNEDDDDNNKEKDDE